MNSNIKSILRKQILSARKILPQEDWEFRNQRIHEFVMDFIRQNNPKVIHSFLPIERNKEVNTWLIIKDLLKEDRQVIISITDFDQETMHHFYYRTDLKFRLNKLKIPEPLNARSANIEETELVLIPLITADKKGNRIGYGKGYYDRLLSKLPEHIIKVGVSLGTLFDSFNFQEPHDIRLNYCITPFELIKCNE